MLMLLLYIFRYLQHIVYLLLVFSPNITQFIQTVIRSFTPETNYNVSVLLSKVQEKPNKG